MTKWLLLSHVVSTSHKIPEFVKCLFFKQHDTIWDNFCQPETFFLLNNLILSRVVSSCHKKPHRHPKWLTMSHFCWSLNWPYAAILFQAVNDNVAYSVSSLPIDHKLSGTSIFPPFCLMLSHVAALNFNLHNFEFYFPEQFHVVSSCPELAKLSHFG